jgi:hypothetical protein
MDLYVSSMAQFKVGTFCWADPRLDFSHLSICHAIQSLIQAHFGMARTSYPSCIIPQASVGATSSSGYFPGGTLTTSTGKWATRSTGKPLVDPSDMGRWSGLRYWEKGANGLQSLRPIEVQDSNQPEVLDSLTSNMLSYFLKAKKIQT